MQEKKEDGSKVFVVFGETNTDDLFPAQGAWSRTVAPLQAFAVLKNLRDRIRPDIDIYPATGGSPGCDQTATTSWPSYRSRLQ